MQEKKAMIVGNGIIAEQITNHVAEVDYILVLDNNIESLTTYIPVSSISGLLGDFDTLKHLDAIKTNYPHIDIIPAPDQEDTDFDKGLQYLITLGYNHIIGFGITGKRMDHTFNNIASLAKYPAGIHIELIDDYSKIICVHDSFEKVYAKDTVISLLPIGKVENITTENLRYPLKNETLELGVRSGSSNVVDNDGAVKISVGKGKLILMECWD